MSSRVRWSAPAPGLLFSLQRAAGDDALAPLAGDVAGTEYVDDRVENGRTYRYAVTARNANDASGPASAAASAAPQAEPLPAPWQSVDLGKPGAKGKASFAPAAGIFTVSGGGDDIWAAQDGGRFVYQPLTGDGTLTAHVVSADATHGYQKVGVMVRASLATGAPMVMVHLSPNGSGCCWRRDENGKCDMVGGDIKPWLRLTRAGDTLRGFVSDDGVTWRPRGETTFALPKEALWGLCVCSHNNWVLNKTLFDHVEWR